jgi:hypothetical protein
MAQCEKCGSTFTPSTDRTEVSSLRILCQPCEAERRAEKAARTKAAAAAQTTARPAASVTRPPAQQAANSAMASAAGLSGAPATGRPSGAPTPASNAPAAAGIPAKNANAAAASPAPAVDGARRARAAAPGASRRTDGPAKPKALASGVRGAQAKSLHGAPAKKLYHKPLKSSDSEHGAENFHPDVQRELRYLQQREGRVMKIAWIVCGVLVLAAGAFALVAKTKRDNDARAIQEAQARIDGFRDEVLKFDVSTEKGANEAIAFVGGHTDIPWQEDSKAGGAVGGVLTKAKLTLEKIGDQKEQTERLAGVEAALQNPGSKSADDLFKARRTIESLESRGESLGKDFDTRVKAARGKIDQTILTRLSEEASAAAKASGESPEKLRAALNAYTRAENEATTILDRVMRMKDEDTKQYYTKEFRRIVDESNAFVTSVFTPEVVERTPWTDLLAADQEKNWQNYGLAGFRLSGGTLEVAGPAPGSTANGLIAVPAAGGYRDFVIDMDFTLGKGTVDWLFRLGRRVDNTVEYYPVSTAGENPLKPGVSYHMAASYIGSKLNVVITPADSPDMAIDSNWTKMRKGAFGGQIHEGVELKITRLKIRELRGA